jgi:hypothetical protein
MMSTAHITLKKYSSSRRRSHDITTAIDKPSQAGPSHARDTFSLRTASKKLLEIIHSFQYGYHSKPSNPRTRKEPHNINATDSKKTKQKPF